MKCPEAEKLIYLLDVLEDGQKEAVHNHMISCQQCQKYYQRLEQEHAIINRAFQVPVGSEVELTRRIMTALPGAHSLQTNPADLILKMLWRRSPQFAFGAVSLLLIGFFIIEFYQPPEIQRSQLQPVAHEKVVELNSRVYYRRGNREKESMHGIAALSLYQCFQACQRLDGECIPCKIKYTRINKHYENI